MWPAGYDPPPPPNSAASSSETALQQSVKCKARRSLSSAALGQTHPARRRPHVSIQSTAAKPPCRGVSKTPPQLQRQTSLYSSIGTTRGPCRTTSAEDMALFRLEPRRRHRSLRVSADRQSSAYKAFGCSSDAGPSVCFLVPATPHKIVEFGLIEPSSSIQVRIYMSRIMPTPTRMGLLQLLLQLASIGCLTGS